jgi:hypothetical protein
MGDLAASKPPYLRAPETAAGLRGIPRPLAARAAAAQGADCALPGGEDLAILYLKLSATATLTALVPCPELPPRPGQGPAARGFHPHAGPGG